MTAEAKSMSLPLPAEIGNQRFHVGTDLVSIGRFRQVLARAPSFVEQVFTTQEASSCAARHDPAIHLAARFAAKEAVLKALRLGLGVPPARRRLQQIEVLSRGPEPALCLHGEIARYARRQRIVAGSLSLTHDDGLALAQVLLISHTSDAYAVPRQGELSTSSRRDTTAP